MDCQDKEGGKEGEEEGRGCGENVHSILRKS